MSGLSYVLRAFAVVVAPTTLLTALFFYFGFMHAFSFFDYFGVNSTLLGFTNRDFVMRSADALFFPATVLGCVTLALVWAHSVVHARLVGGNRPRVLRRVALILAGIGVLLAFGGLLSVFTRTVLTTRLAVAPLCLGGGVLLTLYAVRLRRALRNGERTSTEPLSWPSVAEWAGVFILVALSLFWAATDYSSAVGRSRAHRYAEQLARKPDVVLYSERSLAITAPGVREVRCRDPEGAYRFRYDGLKLMLQSGDQYVFIPAQWSRDNGTAIVIPRSNSLRLEFSRADATPPAAVC